MKNQNNKTLFIVAAGSGGHILPALVLGQAWQRENPSGKIVFIGSSSSLDVKILATHKYISQTILLNIDKFSVKKFWLYPKILFQVIRALINSFKQVFRYKPEKIICTGGLIALPVSIAARLAGIPVELHELNVEPGKAVTILMPFASRIFITFSQSKKLCKFFGFDFSHKCELVKYPIRFTEQDKRCDKLMVFERINARRNPSIHQNGLYPEPESRGQGERQYKNGARTEPVEVHEHTASSCPQFSSTRKTIFILGGSQGSVFLNNLFKKFIETQPTIANSIQVIHQAGPISAYNQTNWPEFYQKLQIPAMTFSYDEKIQDYYAISDLIICRAGAGTLFEIDFFQKPCLIIPLVAQTTDHQIHNALAMAEKQPELFHVLTQKQVTENFDLFSDMILRILVQSR